MAEVRQAVDANGVVKRAGVRQVQGQVGRPWTRRSDEDARERPSPGAHEAVAAATPSGKRIVNAVPASPVSWLTVPPIASTVSLTP